MLINLIYTNYLCNYCNYIKYGNIVTILKNKNEKLMDLARKNKLKAEDIILGIRFLFYLFCLCLYLYNQCNMNVDGKIVFICG
jgi:hypothetical protein